MEKIEWLQLLLFIALLLLIMPPMGYYIAAVTSGRKIFLHPLLGRVELLCYRFAHIDSREEMSWRHYLRAIMIFNLIGFCFLFLMLLAQEILPLNPQHYRALDWPLAFNIAASYVTGTNWQSYSGEVSLSYFSQMVGLGVQNFFSASTGMGVLLALIRGITRVGSETIGNFWQDLVRTVIYLLLPLSLIFALLLVSEGVVQSFSPNIAVETLEGDVQLLPMGPVASQTAIVQLGCNGGGFYNVSGAHPFANPSGWSNFLQLIAIMLLPASIAYSYDLLIDAKRLSWVFFGVMLFFWLGGLAASLYFEHQQNPLIDAYPNLEGKETRIGVVASVLWAMCSTATSNGSVNAMLSSMMPMTGGVFMINLMSGKVIFGGIGTGLCSMILFSLLMVFICGLMVGRTPEFQGKKIEKQEIQWVGLSALFPSTLVLISVAVSLLSSTAMASVSHDGPHALSEILYAFLSGASNNGSSFAGLDANVTYYNICLGAVMILGRLSIVIPSLAVAGALARKKRAHPSAGTLSTETFLFGALLFGAILVVEVLIFFPIFSLGPLLEQLLIYGGGG